MTVGEFVEIYSDLDAYIDRGGRLLDLDLFRLDDLPRDVQAFIAEELGQPLWERLGRFFAAIERAGRESHRKIVDESDLRALWQETQLPPSLH